MDRVPLLDDLVVCHRAPTSIVAHNINHELCLLQTRLSTGCKLIAEILQCGIKQSIKKTESKYNTHPLKRVVYITPVHPWNHRSFVTWYSPGFVVIVHCTSPERKIKHIRVPSNHIPESLIQCFHYIDRQCCIYLWRTLSFWLNLYWIITWAGITEKSVMKMCYRAINTSKWVGWVMFNHG